MTLAPGQVLQNCYRIIASLREGEMGTVYQAWHLGLDLAVAIKEMIPQHGLDAQTLTQLGQQFRQEAAILARLDHPHLVGIMDFFEEEGNAYVVMHFVEGESLADRIKREGVLLEDQVLTWAQQLLDALAYCHSQGIIHRDVKPQNIIIRPDGRAVLVDFGLVKLWDPHDPRTKTAMRGMGTPEYAPPEQYDANSGHTDPRSDIYSLGATLYHSLTGQAPPTATQRMANPTLLQSPRVPGSHISVHIEQSILKAMEPQPDQRFQSAHEMAATLKAKGVSFVTPQYKPTKVMPGVSPVTPVRPRRMPVWGWIVLAVLFSSCLGLVWGIYQQKDELLAALLPSVTHTPIPTVPLTPTPSISYDVITIQSTQQEVESIGNLWNLAVYRDLTQPGTNTYKVKIGPDDKWRWGFSWCAIDDSTLEQILSPLSIQFLIDGNEIPYSKFLSYYDTNSSGWACQRWATILTGWRPDGTIELEVRYNLSASINDGNQTYAQGEYRHIIIVNVE